MGKTNNEESGICFLRRGSEVVISGATQNAVPNPCKAKKKSEKESGMWGRVRGGQSSAFS